MKYKSIHITIFSIVLLGNTLLSQCLPHYNKEVQFVRIEGKRIAYQEKGKGTAVLFLHGLGGNMSHWMNNVAELSKKYRTITLDLPGYGMSDAAFIENTSNTLEIYAKLISDFLQKMKIKDAFFVGHSMGGQLSMLFATQYPNQCKGLILLAPAGIETFTTQEASLLKGFATPSYYAKQDSSTIRNNFRKNFFAFPQQAEILIKDRVQLIACADQLNAYAQTVSAGVAGMLGRPVLGMSNQIQQPMLVVFAENDELIPNKALHPTLNLQQLIQVVQQHWSSSQIIQVKNAGHMLAFEQPQEINQLITSFIQTNTSIHQNKNNKK